MLANNRDRTKLQRHIQEAEERATAGGHALDPWERAAQPSLFELEATCARCGRRCRPGIRRCTSPLSDFVRERMRVEERPLAAGCAGCRQKDLATMKIQPITGVGMNSKPDRGESGAGHGREARR